jgi:hypothetical protein
MSKGKLIGAIGLASLVLCGAVVGGIALGRSSASAKPTAKAAPVPAPAPTKAMCNAAALAQAVNDSGLAGPGKVEVSDGWFVCADGYAMAEVVPVGSTMPPESIPYYRDDAGRWIVVAVVGLGSVPVPQVPPQIKTELDNKMGALIEQWHQTQGAQGASAPTTQPSPAAASPPPTPMGEITFCSDLQTFDNDANTALREAPVAEHDLFAALQSVVNSDGPALTQDAQNTPWVQDVATVMGVFNSGDLNRSISGFGNLDSLCSSAGHPVQDDAGWYLENVYRQMAMNGFNG